MTFKVGDWVQYDEGSSPGNNHTGRLIDLTGSSGISECAIERVHGSRLGQVWHCPMSHLIPWTPPDEFLRTNLPTRKADIDSKLVT